MLCGTIYRSPQNDKSSLTHFFNHLENTLIKITKSNTECYIHGNFNLDLLKTNDIHVETFTDLMLEHNFYSLINKPTRISSTSYSATDIWCNIVNVSIKSAIITHEVSDHLPIIQMSKIGEPLLKMSQSLGWSFTTKDFQKLSNSLLNINWNQLYNLTDLNQSFQIFLKKINLHAKQNFSQKQKNQTQFKCNWYDKELLHLSRKKDNLHKQFIKSKSLKDKEKYQKFRKIYFHTINSKKKKIILNTLKPY